MNVIEFTAETFADIDPDDVLDGAKGQLTEVLVIGRDNEGQLYLASSIADAGDQLLLLELLKRELVERATGLS